MEESCLHGAGTFMPQASLGAQRSGQLAKCICQGKGMLGYSEAHDDPEAC